MRLLRKILCWLGRHRWDGHPEKEYPAPQCCDCKAWHPRREIELEMRLRYPQYHNPDGTIKKMEW